VFDDELLPPPLPQATRPTVTTAATPTTAISLQRWLHVASCVSEPVAPATEDRCSIPARDSRTPTPACARSPVRIPTQARSRARVPRH
jgi:hypothetical protein